MIDIRVRCPICTLVYDVAEAAAVVEDFCCPECLSETTPFVVEHDVFVQLNWTEVMALYITSKAAMQTVRDAFTPEQLDFYDAIYDNMAAMVPETGMPIYSEDVTAIVNSFEQKIRAATVRGPIRPDPKLPVS